MRRERGTSASIQRNILAMLAVAGLLFVIPAVVNAATVNLGLTPEVGSALGLGTADIRVIAARIIRNFFGLLGIVAVVLILYGGFLWMTSGGDEDQVAKAKQVIVNAVIGLAIMLMAVAIVQFIISRLLLATGTGFFGGPGGGSGYVPKSGALGQGIIENHYPERGQTEVPRNTRIVITFKEKMDLASFIKGYDPASSASSTAHDLEDANILIYKKEDGPDGALGSSEVKVYYTADQKTFVFHTPLLGSPTDDTAYIVSLAGGVNGIRKIEGAESTAAFEGAFALGYEWDFTTGTFIDTTPPKVVSVVPFPGSTHPRNVLVQMNFDEPIDPTTASGDLPAFANLSVLAGADPVAGSFAIGNRYRTIEFTSNDLCGTNSCGGDVFCLPPSATILTRAKAATLGPTPPQADPTKIPADGVTDMVGNSLDGNANGTSEGPGDAPEADDYLWSFKTTDTVDLTPPAITATVPDINTGKVAPDRPIDASWSKLMSLTSFTSEAVSLDALPTPPEPTCYTLSGENLDIAGLPVTSAPPVTTRMRINHCLFFPETNYVPTVTSKIKDLYQNCYFPGARQNLQSCSPEAMASGNYSYCCNGKPCSQACALQGSTVLCPSS